MPTTERDLLAPAREAPEPKTANGVWTLAAPIASPDHPSPTYQWIEAEILSGRLAPGSKLDLDQLAALSDAPTEELRDALLRLSNDGLVRQDAAAALRVSPVSIQDLNDLTATRIIIEGEALRRSIRAGDAAWVARVAAAYGRLAEIDPQMPSDRRDLIDCWEQCNHDFHDALVSACDLLWIKRFNDVLYKHHERYRRLSLRQRAAPRDVHGEHLALYQAAVARDVDAALSVIADHIGRTADTLTSGIRDGGWFGAPPQA